MIVFGSLTLHIPTVLYLKAPTEAQQSPVRSPILNDEIPTPHVSPKHVEIPTVDEVIPESPVASHTIVMSEHNESSSISEDSVSVETPVPPMGKKALKQLKITALSTKHLQDDAKKGEKIVKSKYSEDQILKKTYDETDDQGNPSQGRGQAQSKQSSKVKLNSEVSKSSTQKKTNSEAAQTQNLIASTEIQNLRSSSDEQSLTKPDVLIQGGSQDSQKFMQTLKIKGKQTIVYYKDPKIQTLDEEIARRLFLKHNPGMDLDNLKEEEARFKAEKTNLKSKAYVAKKPPRPKEKGIEKVDEPTKFQKRKISSVVIDPIYQTTIHDDDPLTEEDVQTLKRKKNLEESKTTSDKAQVVQSEEHQAKAKAARSDKVKKSTSDSAQVDLDKMEVADKKKLLWKNVKPSDPKKDNCCLISCLLG
ncbi:hypothetical protein AgCh_003930 [Apium graveolens]